MKYKKSIKLFEGIQNVFVIIGMVTMVSYWIVPIPELFLASMFFALSTFIIGFVNLESKMDMVYKATCPDLVAVA